MKKNPPSHLRSAYISHKVQLASIRIYCTAISIHAPLTRCDGIRTQLDTLISISIHAPLTRCGRAPFRHQRRASNFNPRTSYEVRRRRVKTDPSRRDFNPRTSHEVRRQRRHECATFSMFQSTHLSRGATEFVTGFSTQMQVSIHAPLTRCDPIVLSGFFRNSYFNPRTSYEVRQEVRRLSPIVIEFQSTHLLRGATPAALVGSSFVTYFNPRTSYEVRREVFTVTAEDFQFQSTHLLRGATRPRLRDDAACSYFNPRTSYEVRRGPQIPDGAAYNFNPRTSYEVRQSS